MNSSNIIILIRILLTLSIIGILYFAFIWFLVDKSGEAGYAILLGIFIPILLYFNKIVNKNKLEEKSSSKIQKVLKKFDNYDIELQGKVTVPNNFKPFRISISNEDPDDPSEWALNETLNMKKPFYTIKTKINTDTINKTSHVIYNRYLDDKENETMNGYVYRITITNITDVSEDIIIHSKVLSSITRTGNANRILTTWDMGGAGDYIKLNKNILLKEKIEKFKFKDADYITLKSGESIILAVAYIAEEQGVYLPRLTLDISYANAKGNLTIKLPELIVPKLFGWVSLFNNFEYLTDMNKFIEGNDDLGMTWYLYDEKTYEVKEFSFSRRRLSKDELKFMGNDYCEIFLKKLISLKETKSMPNQFTDIENYNIKLVKEIERELTNIDN